MKHTKLFAAIAAGLALIASSCSNIADASVSKSTDSTRTLNISVTNYDTLVSASQSVSAGRAEISARTIIPESFKLNGISLYLSGKATNGQTFGPAAVTATATNGSALTDTTTVGKIAIPADIADWEFTLYATPTTFSFTSGTTTDANILKEAVLIGYSSMSMTNGDTAKFTLSPDGLTKEAAVALKLYLDSSWTTVPSGYSAKAGIYLLTTGADATTAGDGAGSTGTETSLYTDIADTTTPFPTSAPATANYTLTSMTPGTYLFKVTFESSASGKKFEWSDIIIVLPGKNLDNEVAIQNVIGVKPTAPADFKAGYITGSEDKYNGYYTAALSWTRNTSKNENNFEIDVIELSSTDATATVPAKDTWDSAGTSVTYGADFSSSDAYESGSLLSGNTEALLRLELGKRYWARIRAVNDAGSSDDTYVSVGSAVTPTVSDTSKTAAAFTGNTINRYRISYNLNGGTIYTGTATLDLSALTGGSTADIVKYFCQETASGTPVIKPDNSEYKETTAAAAAYYYLKNGESPWSSWKDGSGAKLGGDTDTVIPGYVYKGYANLDLYAAYDGSAGVSILDKSAYDIKASWITLDDTALSGNTASIDITDANKDTGAAWKITPADIKDSEGNDITSTFAFDSVSFTVSRGGTTAWAATEEDVGSSGATFTQPLSTLSAGVYNVVFTARYGSSIHVSYSVTTTVTR